MKKILALFIFSASVYAQSQSMSDMFMQKMDQNQDGKVDKAEFLTPYEAQFNMIDTNHDGAIEKEEIESVERRMKERIQQMRRQHQ